MSEWKEYKIGDILQLEYGKSLMNYQEGIGLYDVFGTNGKIGKTDKYLYNKPSIIIGRKGAYREVHFANNPFFVIDTAFYTRNKFEWLDTSFLYYWFKNIDINQMDSGSAIPSTSRDEIYDLDILLPDENEQKSISSVLSSLDDKISLLYQQNQTLEKVAETLFWQWFVGEAKEEWDQGTLDNILTVKGGTTPSTNESKYWDGTYHWTSPRDITSLNELYLFDTERKITELGLGKISSGLLPKGTLLMTSRAPVGVFTFCEVPVAINQGYIAIVDNKGYSKEFLYLMLKQIIDIIHSFSNGSTFMEISKSAFKSIQIQVPPLNLTDDFQNIIMPCFKKIKANHIQIRKLAELRDKLLPKLVSGELRLKQ